MRRLRQSAAACAADGLDGGNGVFKYSDASTFPTDTYGAGNYWVLAVFDGGSSTGDTTAPQAVTTLPAGGATNVNTGTGVTASFSESLAPASVNATTFTLKTASGVPVPATVTYNAANVSAKLQPASGLAVNTTYVATIAGGAAGVKDVAGNALAANVTWSFTTRAACSVSVLPGTARPPGRGTPPSSDGATVEVGSHDSVRMLTGQVDGIRFYKGNGNNGTHVGDLWTGSGTLLARGIFTSESASGWQELRFATPVSIAANTTYVASYYAPQGSYASDRQARSPGAGVDAPAARACGTAWTAATASTATARGAASRTTPTDPAATGST